MSAFSLLITKVGRSSNTTLVSLMVTFYKACVVLRHGLFFATPWIVAYRVPLSMEFSRQEYWSGLPFPASGDLPNPRLKPKSLASPMLAGGFFTTAPLIIKPN